ncbi:MAG: hypothetical protein ACFE9Z_08040, partial [Promethearchaeota archaeon]
MSKVYKLKIINRLKSCLILMILLINLGIFFQITSFKVCDSQDSRAISEKNFNYDENLPYIKSSNSLELKNDLNITWGWSIGDERSFDVKTDSQNNVYVTGDSDSYSSGSADLVLIKYDSSGNQLWNRSWGFTHFDSGRSIAFDSLNNILVGGLTYNSTKSAYDVVILKFDPDGNLISELIWGDNLSDYCEDIILDSNDNLYFVGSTYNFGAVLRDVLLVKFNSSWEFQWKITFGSDGYDSGQAITIDSSDCVYICGRTIPDIYRKFVIKYNSTGDQQWIFISGGVGSIGNFYDLVLDDNNFTYVCGYSE